jgi:hypothetical protein
MKLIRYGITLRRMTIDDIEMVRNARNKVRHLMDYKEFITPVMQLRWFNSINNANNYYNIIEYGGIAAGLIHEKNATTTPGLRKEDSEGGIFMFDSKYYQTPAPVLAVLILLEKGFFIYGDNDSVIHVMKTNEEAIKFNKALGYQLCKNQENIARQKYILTKERFIAKTKKIRKAALSLSKSENNLIIVLSKPDYETEFGAIVENINQKVGLKYEINEQGDKIYKISFDTLS